MQLSPYATSLTHKNASLLTCPKSTPSVGLRAEESAACTSADSVWVFVISTGRRGCAEVDAERERESVGSCVRINIAYEVIAWKFEDGVRDLILSVRGGGRGKVVVG